MRQLLKFLGIAFLASVFATSALAKTSVENEISTAIDHAEFSVKANDVATIHLHLHHVVNCLVGEKGKQFSAASGDPCKGMGDGAINDAQNPALKKQLESILTVAETGLNETEFTHAHKTASLVKRMLKQTLAQMKMP